MQVVDEVTGKLVSKGSCVTVVVEHLSGQVVLGYTSRKNNLIEALFWFDGGFKTYRCIPERLSDLLLFSSNKGKYFSKVDVPEDVLFREQYTLGCGLFPYKFDKKYEAIENFKRFEGKQKVLCPKKYKLAEHLKYTFGLEFETSQGYIPEDICYKDGLIPLRDGSISGIEYSTVVLSGDDGLALLEQQLHTLKKYTWFNKECSLHIHMGGFPLSEDTLFKLYILCKSLESRLASLLPRYTFNTSEYKANGKDYCKQLPTFRNFQQMYELLVGRKFYGDFSQPHPNDIRREAKWRIPTRYYWVNFINALCYGVNKTIEFRFLRPSYNFQKILLWLYILNAILRYAEVAESLHDCKTADFETILYKVYPPELAKELFLGITKLNIVAQNQYNNGDYIGSDITLDDKVFNKESTNY